MRRSSPSPRAGRVLHRAAVADPISLGEAITLGALQGATEFLPVSSDGHLALGAFAFHLGALPLPLTVMLHAGTLVATLIVFRADVTRLTAATVRGLRAPRAFFATPDGALVRSLVVATIPTGLVGLFLEKRVEPWSDVPWIVGAGFLGSALWLLLTLASPTGRDRKEGGGGIWLSVPASVLVGVIQGLAVLPGLSRSGSTIGIAMLLGLAGPEAFRYAFLLSLPAVGGAVLLEARHTERLAGLGAVTLVGAVVAFFVGLGALYLLRGVVARGRVWLFAVYLVPLGLGTILWGALR